MIYRLMGLLHTRIGLALNGERMMQLRRDERGQGTVEYVALILLVAALLAGVVAATKSSTIGDGGIARGDRREDQRCDQRARDRARREGWRACDDGADGS